MSIVEGEVQPMDQLCDLFILERTVDPTVWILDEDLLRHIALDRSQQQQNDEGSFVGRQEEEEEVEQSNTL